MNVDLGRVGRELKLTAESVQRTVELLDEGNTVPFVTRYRKDQTGGLDEEQIRAVQVRVNQMRQVAERKQTILKSIEAQGQLTPELTNRINNTHSPKRLEDIYLPFKPKKQTLATAARERGLLPLALEIENGVELDLQQRATELVDPAKQVDSIDDVFRGVQHILAERISERPDVRAALRELFRKTGVVVSKAANDATPTRGGTDHPADAAPAESTPTESTPADTAPTDATSTDATPTESTPTNPAPTDAPPTDATPTDATPTDATPTDATSTDATSTDATSTDATSTDATPTESTPTNPAPTDAPPTDATPTDAASTDVTPTDTAPTDATPTDAATTDATSTDATAADTAPPDATATESTPPDESAAAAATTPSEETPPVVDPTPSSASPGANAGANVEKPASAAPVMAAAKVVRSSKPTESASQARRRKKRERAENAFKDYFDFREPVNKAPPHRILALNRGERAKVLRVRVECDSDALLDLANKTVLPDEHAHRDIVQASIKDAVIRLVLPSLERELRRELTERAELHAVEVFVRNLRKLLLQPPVHNRTVLAIDPGFKSGCKLAVVDCFGRVLATDVMHIVGKADRLQRSKKRLAALVRKHSVDVIAIGNGAACRETEQLVSEVIESGSVHAELAFVIVNEAGASVYSTSPIGREELPDHEAIQRSAISLARRLLDPLSELVKINPANIGVGLYQHDVRAKHLRESLDAVVESCVNYVGVNVNTASPALLGYVSGLNQLKARRLYEYRLEHGPFRNRQQFKDVPGFGDATFVQAAGFLKITDGDNPLDATWIHPESYDAARVLLTKLDSSETELQTMIEPVAAPPPAEPTPTPAPSTQAVSETAPAETAQVETAQVETAPTETTPVETTPVETTPAEAAPAETAPVESAPAETAPAEPAPAEPAPTETTPAEAAPAETAPVETAPAETAPAETAPVEATPVEATPVEAAPTEAAPTEAAPVETTPVETTPVESSPAETAPAETAPAETAPTEPAPTETTPVETAPVEAAATEETAPTETAPTPAEASATDTGPPDSAPEDAAAEAAAAEAARVGDAAAVDRGEASPVQQVRRRLEAKTESLDRQSTAAELGIGEMLLADLLAALVRPNRDPREDFPPPTFRREIMKLDDLEPGMQLTAVVLNVVDFGAFVDIGLTESGLIHISRLADRFIRDPHAVVSVGDKLPVWVVEIDKGRRRVSLTAIAPGSEKPREKRGRAPAQKKTPRTVRKDQGQQGDARKAKRKGKRAGSKPPPPPKVVKKAKPDPPITKKMIEGNEPMRTFGDLAQFYEKKSTDEEPGDKK